MWDIKNPNTTQSKNLFDFNNAQYFYNHSKIQITKVSNGYTLTGVSGQLYLELGPIDDFIDKTLTISMESSCKFGWFTYFVQMADDGNRMEVHNTSHNTLSFSESMKASQATKLGIVIHLIDNGQNRTCTFTNIQVEESNTATAYEPYGGLYIPQSAQ